MSMTWASSKSSAASDHAVAVVADTWWHAKTALDALPIVWDEGDNAKVSSASIAKWLEEGLDSAQPAFIGNQNGDAKLRLRARPRKSRRSTTIPTRTTPRWSRLNATALYTADKCECGAERKTARPLSRQRWKHPVCPPTKCEVHKQILGGGFGRRGQTDYVRQAVSIAKANAGHSDQAVVVARRRHAARHVSPDHAQCKLTGAFDADNNLTRCKSGCRDSRSCSPCVPRHWSTAWIRPHSRASMQPAKPRSDIRCRTCCRTFDAQSSRSAGILARRECQSQRHLS